MKKEKRNENKFLEDGVILLNKEKGISSFACINKLKWLINGNKVGHAGTLDPMAEGLLIVMMNNATKFSDDLMKKDKEYYVEMKLGYETDTYDEEGSIIKKCETDFTFSKEKITEVLYKFLGEIYQIPPMYSAIKVNGEKLYNLARKGIEIEREKRKVKINYINDIKYDDIEKKISFIVGVSSGTYIRSLVRDIGENLGVYGTMTKLIRTKIDNFSLNEAITLDKIIKFYNFENDGENIVDIEKNEKLKEIINFKNINILFKMEKIYVNIEEYKKLKNGMTLVIDFENKYKKNFKLNEKYLVFLDENSKEESDFFGIVKVIKLSQNKIYLKREKYFK